MLQRAEELWQDLEADHDSQLLYRTGSIDASPEGDALVEGSKRSCEEHDLEYDLLSSSELTDRFPGYRLPKGTRRSISPRVDFAPEECTVAHVNRAHRDGATIRARERVVDWRPTDGGVRVETDHGAYEADRLVITAGAWAARFVDELEGVAVPERQVLAWLQPTEPDQFDPERFPVWNLQVPEGGSTASPSSAFRGSSSAATTTARRPSIQTPSNARRHRPTSVSSGSSPRYFPTGAGPTMRLQTCLFTNTPDDHFVLDTLPDHPRSQSARAFLATASSSPASSARFSPTSHSRETDHDVDLFSLDRFD